MITAHEYSVRWREGGTDGALKSCPLFSEICIMIGDTLCATNQAGKLSCLRVLTRVIRSDRPTLLLCCETVNVFEDQEAGM